MIFSRPIKDCPLFIEVTEHNPPLISFGARGTKEKGFMQPCNVTVDRRNNVFVVDTVLFIDNLYTWWSMWSWNGLR